MDEAGPYERPNRYEPQPPKPPLLPPWLKALLIIGGAGLVVFLLIQLAIWQVREKVAGPAPVPAAPVAPAPKPPPPPAEQKGSQMFSFNEQSAVPAEAASPPPPPVPAESPAPPPASPAAPAPPAAPAAPAAPPSNASAVPPTASATAAASGPLFDPRREPAAADVVTDEAIDAAIKKGAEHLISRFENGRLKGDPANPHYIGTDALCVLALLHAGQAVADERLNVRNPFMARALDELRQLSVPESLHTYSRSLRAQALAVYHRKEDSATLASDTRALLTGGVRGAYTYTVPPAAATRPEQMTWDNSNSQYGVLGVWAAAEAGVAVPLSYWQGVQEHWENCQSPDGGWGYHGPGSGSSLSMTAAGVNMLFVANEMISAQRPEVQVARPPFSASLQGGLDWLGHQDRSINLAVRGYQYYTLYGLERAGLASGFKMLGKHDWFRTLAARTLKEQEKDGSWGLEHDTAFAILFLARGRHPLLMNKLHFVGAWANRPRDVAHLAKFVSKETERPLNWQVVSLASDWTDWMDAPVLYLASHEAPIFDENDFAKLKAFVDAGGLLFTHADGDSKEFNQWAAVLAMKLFGGRELKDLPPNHFAYNALFRPKEPFPLRGISNNTRLLMLHSPTDLARRWQGKDPKADRGVYELGANLFIYATGMQVPRNRLETLAVAEVTAAPAVTIPIARLKYAGDWDPEPYAWTRQSRLFRRATGAALEPVAIETEKLAPDVAPIAHLTATAPLALSDAQVAALKRYVDAGGVLLLDATGGFEPVAQSIRANILARAFPGKEPAVIKTDHPLLAGAGPGMQQIARPQVRPFTLLKLQQKFPRLQLLESGRGAVVISELDLTSGLLGTSTLGIIGWEPEYAQKVAQNLILWAVNARPTRTAWTSTTQATSQPATRPAAATTVPTATAPAAAAPGAAAPAAAGATAAQ